MPAVDEGSAYRPLPVEMAPTDVFCFNHQRKVARDNTVKYQWRTLQLLPDQDRTSHAGRAVEVWERLDGELTVLYEGQEIATQEAPPRACVLRSSKGDNLYKDRTKLMEQVEACLPAAAIRAKKKAAEARRPTSQLQAYREPIHEAKRRGLPLRAIARELGISRSTVVRYVRPTRPPVYREGSLEEEAKEQRLTESLVSSP